LLLAERRAFEPEVTRRVFHMVEAAALFVIVYDCAKVDLVSWTENTR